MSIKCGDIVIADLTFENGSVGKGRLCLVVNDSLVELIEAMNITSREKKHIKTNKLIKANSSNKLDVDSYVKTDKKYTIKKSDVKRLIGHESEWKKYI